MTVNEICKLAAARRLASCSQVLVDNPEKIIRDARKLRKQQQLLLKEKKLQEQEQEQKEQAPITIPPPPLPTTTTPQQQQPTTTTENVEKEEEKVQSPPPSSYPQNGFIIPELLTPSTWGMLASSFARRTFDPIVNV